MLGKLNTGKTTLFNRLCGLRAKTANFLRTTTDLRVGRLQLPDIAADATECLRRRRPAGSLQPEARSAGVDRGRPGASKWNAQPPP
ncbi:MAG: 50S ribosome-binding GTPase [Betaproteobacteria bacterium]|nr:50S ribosome-binding GTPase [Betaproteobacteria bacterium]